MAGRFVQPDISWAVDSLVGWVAWDQVELAHGCGYCWKSAQSMSSAEQQLALFVVSTSSAGQSVQAGGAGRVCAATSLRPWAVGGV